MLRSSVQTDGPNWIQEGLGPPASTNRYNVRCAISELDILYLDRLCHNWQATEHRHKQYAPINWRGCHGWELDLSWADNLLRADNTSYDIPRVLIAGKATQTVKGNALNPYKESPSWLPDIDTGPFPGAELRRYSDHGNCWDTYNEQCQWRGAINLQKRRWVLQVSSLLVHGRYFRLACNGYCKHLY
jgi:hypothetical protein